MIRRRVRYVSSIAGKALVALLVCGCGPAWRPPVYQKQGFHLQWVDQITVVAAVDLRIDRSIEVDLDKQLRDAAVTILTDKGYATVVSPEAVDIGSVNFDDLKDAEPAWVSHLGPPTARWVMVVSLVDVTTSLTFGSTGNA